MNYQLIRKGGGVKRFHTHPLLGENTVAAHSWGVATILLHICEPSMNLIKAALYHDIFEYLTGDVPFTAKRDTPELAAALEVAERKAGIVMEVDILWNLLPEEEVLLKTADMLDLCFFCIDQVKLGNSAMNSIFNNGYQFLVPHLRIHPNEKASHLLAQLYFGSTNDG